MINRLFMRGLLAAFLVLAGHQAAWAVAEQNLSPGLTGTGSALAAHGYDTVAFFTVATPVRGQAKYQTEYKGATYRFSSQDNLDAFKKRPARYVPQYGGYCAYGASVGKKFDGDPRYWKVANDKLYFNLNADISRLFNKDVSGTVRKADKQWQKIVHKAPADL